MIIIITIIMVEKIVLANLLSFYLKSVQHYIDSVIVYTWSGYTAKFFFSIHKIFRLIKSILPAYAGDHSKQYTFFLWVSDK